MENLLPLFVVVPLGLAFILPVLKSWKRYGDLVADIAATLGALLLLVGSAYLLAQERTLIYWVGLGHWDLPVLGINLVSDGLSRFLLFTVCIVTFVSTVFSVPYMKRYTSKPLYYSLFLLMVAGMNGVVLTGDMFNLFVFLEIASISSYALVAFGCEREELEASFKYLVLGAIASTLVLFGVGLLYGVTGYLNMGKIASVIGELGAGRHATVLLAGAFLTTGLGLKAAMVPFHAWLPDAHPSAPAPISAMLSGVLIKACGVYALCRILFNVLGAPAYLSVFGTVLIGMGALSMIVGVLLAVGQWDFKRLLAYHSISQMGYVVLGLGVGGLALAKSPGSAAGGLAIFGALFHLFNHAMFKSCLFLSSGAIEHATGTRLLKKMGGLGHRMPLTSACCRIAALSISGVPPFNGFWSKLIIIVAVIQAGHYGLGALTVLVSFLTLVSFVKVQRYALHGDVPAHLGSVREAPGLMGLALVLLAFVCTVGGVGSLVMHERWLKPAQEALSDGVGYAKTVLPEEPASPTPDPAPPADETSQGPVRPIPEGVEDLSLAWRVNRPHERAAAIREGPDRHPIP